MTQLALEPHPRSAAQARAWIIGQLSAIERHDLIESAELGLSELVTNSIVHARTPILVTLVVTSGQVRIEVQDGSSVRPTPAHASGADEPPEPPIAGRGIDIVDALASEWGIRVDHSPGKTVWFSPTAAATPDGRGETDLSVQPS